MKIVKWGWNNQVIIQLVDWQERNQDYFNDQLIAWVPFEEKNAKHYLVSAFVLNNFGVFVLVCWLDDWSDLKMCDWQLSQSQTINMENNLLIN